MFGVGPIEILILLFLLVALAFVAVTLRRSSSGNSVEEILDRRYASGELTREEYLDIRGDIKREQNA